MSYIKKLVGQLSRLTSFVTCGALLATVPINADMSSVLAQEIKLTPSPSVIAQYPPIPIYRGNNVRQLRAESGPDNIGRWRFYKPSDITSNEMQAQGCSDVGGGGASWRCPGRLIRVQVNNNDQNDDYRRPDYGRPNNGSSVRQLRAESGPDNIGRWRFYKPSDITSDEMRSQGCSDVGGGGASWRCPGRLIRVQVNNNDQNDDYGRRNNGRPDYGRRNNGRPDYGRPNYGGGVRQLRAESGPDNRGRWRFDKPDDVTSNEMQAQGCTFVGGRGVNWRCSSRMIRVRVDRRR